MQASAEATADLLRAHGLESVRLAGVAGSHPYVIGEWMHAGDDALVLAADTVVVCGRRILPKAEDAGEVERCLRLLSGRRHQVMTALALIAPGVNPRTRVVTTRVAFKVLTPQEIADYVASGEGEGKAGGYAIQGRAEALVKFINGSYSNVVGLPLYEAIGLLNGCGAAR